MAIEQSRHLVAEHIDKTLTVEAPSPGFQNMCAEQIFREKNCVNIKEENQSSWVPLKGVLTKALAKGQITFQATFPVKEMEKLRNVMVICLLV